MEAKSTADDETSLRPMEFIRLVVAEKNSRKGKSGSVKDKPNRNLKYSCFKRNRGENRM